MRSIARGVRRALSIALWGLVILAVGSLVAADETAGQEAHRAALIVDFGGEGNVETSCVSFSEDEISGADLLRRSGMAVVFSGFGGLGSGVCQIEGEGCSDPGNCFCQCTGANCRYWSYWVLEDGAWRYQQVGASGRDVAHGEVHAWIWGNGRTPPDPASYGDVCPLTLPATPPRPTQRPQGSNPQPEAGEPTPLPRGGPGRPIATASNANEATVEPTSRTTEQVRGAIATPAKRDRDAASAARSTGDEGSGGAPVGLIAFGAIAGALVLAIGGLVLRRRVLG